MDHPLPPEYREPHNRCSSFSGSDDVLLVRTVLENLDIFSFIQSQRTRAWKIITQCLCDQGITCTTESVRYRIDRLAESYWHSIQPRETSSSVGETLCPGYRTISQAMHGPVKS
uniref:Uncharacterized protein n=1 Tax=Hyaloperonospora arabidopsidis (strain Emoy2) TaxID=559515 RepID=M4BG71_HYAAE